MFTAEALYGVQPQIPGSAAGVSKPTGSLGMSPDGPGGWPDLVDIHNPLFVFGVILAITLGAAGVSGAARVGPAKVSAELGDAD